MNREDFLKYTIAILLGFIAAVVSIGIAYGLGYLFDYIRQRILSEFTPLDIDKRDLQFAMNYKTYSEKQLDEKNPFVPHDKHPYIRKVKPVKGKKEQIS